MRFLGRLDSERTRLLAVLAIAFSTQAALAQQPLKVSVDWKRIDTVSKTTPTLQVVVNPMLERGSPIHDGTFAALKELGADYVRYVPWLPYPRMAVAELQAPAQGATSWDFKAIDPMTLDFLNATQGHSTILNFSTAPAWMFKTERPVTYPDDPNHADWNYTQGTELRDASMRELGDYYARLVSWYANGGFTDEAGKQHSSGYHYAIPYWEVFNEVDFEHHMTPQQYTERYDAVVSAIHKVSPGTRFVGLALAAPSSAADTFEYFLDHKHHQAGIPLDMISYHFYATPTADENIDTWQFTFFDQADGFLNTVRYVESIRKRLSPETRTTLDELGVILASDSGQDRPDHVNPPLPPEYWNLAGGMYAYLYVQLARLGIDVAGESQLVGYPTQYPSVSMMNWTNARPNARFWVLKLLKDNFGPGDKLAHTTMDDDAAVMAQAFDTASGKKLLLINKRHRAVTISVPAEFSAGKIERVDASTGDNAPATSALQGVEITLAPFAVSVLKANP